MTRVIGTFKVVSTERTKGILEQLDDLSASDALADADQVLGTIEPMAFDAAFRQGGMSRTLTTGVGSRARPHEYIPKLVKSGRLEDFWDWWHGQTVEEVHFHEPVWLPVGEVHCPRIKGCTASLEEKTTRGVEASGKATILGFGGAGDLSTKIMLTKSLEAPRACGTLETPAKVKVTTKRDKKTGQKATFAEVTELLELGIGIDPISPAADRCFKSASALVAQGLVEVPCHVGLKAATGKLSDFVGKAREFDILAGPNLPGLPVQVQFTGKMTWEKDLTWAYGLSGARDYAGYRAVDAAGVLWPKDGIRPATRS